MATSDLDIDGLISRLSGPLLPPARIAFRAAALDALTRVPCLGEGAIYRAIAGLQRCFFDPPPDDMRREGARHLRPSKLQNLPAVGAPDPRENGRARNSFRAG